MLQRPRRLRQSEAIRSIHRENHLQPEDFLAPLFVLEGDQQKQEIPSMPGYFRYSLDLIIPEVRELARLGCKALLLFVKVEEADKGNPGEEAWNPQGLMQRSIRKIKAELPEISVFTDVALDPYSQYGHDGIVKDGRIDNDATLLALQKMALSHAQAGADFVAPSDMMDGRVAAIRNYLDEHSFPECGIMAYSAKYASCFYGPFRDALDSAPSTAQDIPAHKKSYQMDPANAREASREVELDLREGADMVMVKPAMAYLDIIRQSREQATVPVAAYHVSGEYAMIKAAALQGWLQEEEAMLESLIAIKRAGADLIATYFVHEILIYLRKEKSSLEKTDI